MKRLTLEQARQYMTSGAEAVGTEWVSVYDSIGRVLSEDITAAMGQPPFPRSAMDGYALRWEDVQGASRENPAVLRVAGRLCAGDEGMPLGKEGVAIRIMTGAVIPPDANCVIRQEDTDYGEEWVKIFAEGRPQMNCCPAGEDFAQGEKLASAGMLVDAYLASSAASAGMAALPVRRRVKVALISSGEELCLPGEPLSPGKIYDSNRVYLTARCRHFGCDVVLSKTVGDDKEAIAGNLKEALAAADYVITTGGVSVGQKDLMPGIIKNYPGAEPGFHGILVKPGMPTLFARICGRPVLSLSGNPYSAAAIFELLGVPLLHALQGRRDAGPFMRTAVLAEAFPKKRPCLRIVRGYYDGEKVLVAAGQKNGQMKAGIGTNCLVLLPAGTAPIPAGETVKVYQI